jgi:hypothetical protein
MRLTRVRFTIRGLMVAIAILAVVLGIVDGVRRRRESFARRARMYAQKARDEIRDAENYQITRRGSEFGYDARTTAAHYELVEHYWALQEKYDQAAARPWRLIAPDPPAPVWPKNVPRDPPWTKEDADRLPHTRNR